MFNLFNKSKVRAGKQNKDEKKPLASAAPSAKKPAAMTTLNKTWAKLNAMDRKQVYTWGAVAVVVVVVLITLGTAAGSGDENNFADFESRGYDLANMPFSSDEAEQYLLASKYPDMKDSAASGLYSKEEKAMRQAEDAQEAQEQEMGAFSGASSSASQYVPGRYYGGGGAASRTRINSMNSASLKGAGGSGMSGSFGPRGDFSNFKSQEKGKDVFNAQKGPGSGSARKALYQSAVGSRAAAGQKDSRLLNAKKAMMGGNVQGSNAFLSDSGAVDLSKAAGLNLDENAPVSSVDTGAFDNALNDAAKESSEEAAEEEEAEWWQTLLQDMAMKLVEGLLSMGLNAGESAIANAQETHRLESAAYQDWMATQNIGSLAQGEVNINTVMTTPELRDNYLDTMGYKFDAEAGTITNKQGVVVGKKGADGNFAAEPGQTLSVTQKQADKINKGAKKTWEANHPQEVAQTKAGAHLRAQQAVSGSGYNFNGRGANSPDTIKVNGVTVQGKHNADGTFTGTNGNKYTSSKEGTETVWTMGN